MTEQDVVVASAVVVPEEAEKLPSPTSLAKRRQSGGSDSSTKRLRLDSNVDDDRPPEDDRPGPATSIIRDERRVSGRAEERKRGQRLFGALLGTLSQSSSSKAQNRRADIEKKQQAKLKMQAAEYDERKKADLDRLMAVRRREQKKFKERSMRIRHSNLRAMVNFLRTSSEPCLYYKPWDLLPEEEARIKSQKAEAEAIVEREVQEYEERRKEDQDQDDPNDDQLPPTNKSNGTAANVTDQQPEQDTVGSETDPPASHPAPHTDDDPTLASNVASAKEHPEDGDGGEIVLEAEEDTVIY